MPGLMSPKKIWTNTTSKGLFVIAKGVVCKQAASCLLLLIRTLIFFFDVLKIFLRKRVFFMDEIVRVSGIYKNFAGVQALEDVNLTLYQGQISCLVGENGSGKSTLIKIIAGVYQPTEGEVALAGKTYSKVTPIEAINAGIQVIYQDFALFPNLTVAENIALNYELSEGKRFVNWGKVYDIAEEALKRTEIDLPLNARVRDLSVADKQLVAISRAILQNARLIIMDEPTTALTEREVESLFKVIYNLQDNGISILFVSHKLNEVLEIAERVIVLRDGQKVFDDDAESLDQNKISYHMTGQEISEEAYDYQPDKEKDHSLLRVENLSRAGSFTDISFELHHGEILGVTGLLGSGRTDLALALFGVRPAQSGSIYIEGNQVSIDSIQNAIDHQIGYVPEDRLTEGLFLEQSVESNLIVRTVAELRNSAGLIQSSSVRDRVKHWIDRLNIKVGDPGQAVSGLSGGNQQRVVIAKWLADEPRILILNGPTVGVDIGSKTEIHELIKDLARDGIGIIIMSDDIPELMQTTNRILLMRKGRIENEFNTTGISSDELSEKLREAAQFDDPEKA
jgi:simple sugar transport system ATP-binding protein